MKKMIGRRLLIVEPNRATAELLRDRLDAPNLSVRIARSGDEALDRLDREHFDAVLSALEMAAPDGLELVRALRGRGQLTPVVLLSSDREHVVEDDTRVMMMGRAVVMHRPVRIRWLFRTLESILKVSLDRRESRRSPRVPLRVQVLASVAGGRELRGTSVDLSAGGISFARRTCEVCTGCAPSSVHPDCVLYAGAKANRRGEPIEVSMFFHGRPYLTVRGRIVHASIEEGSSREVIGVEFTGLDERQQMKLEELLGGDFVGG